MITDWFIQAGIGEEVSLDSFGVAHEKNVLSLRNGKVVGKWGRKVLIEEL